jgi:ABC-type Fe3+ transport system permease subunit
MDAPQRCRAAAGAHAVTQRDSERIARQWKREIEDKIRREAARTARDGPWKAVTWGALWLFWLLLLVALVGQIKSLG